MWFSTLGVVLAIGLGALVPGLAAWRVEGELGDRLGGVRPQVRLEGDPIFEFPAGRVRKVTVELDGVPVGPVRVPDLDVELTDVRLPAGALYGLGRPRLLAPAQARVRAGGTAAQWTALATGLVSGGTLASVEVPLAVLKGRLGGEVAVLALAPSFEPGRIGLNATLKTGKGEQLVLGASCALRVVGGTQVMLAEPRATIGDKEIPKFLLGLAVATLGPVFDLDDAALPGRSWTLTALDVGPAGIWAEARGEVTDLAAAGPAAPAQPTP